MGTRSKGLKYGGPRDKNPLRNPSTPGVWDSWFLATFARPPKVVLCSPPKRFRRTQRRLIHV